jgi:hypothetical protein
MAESKKPGFHFKPLESEGRYVVAHDVGGTLGEIQKLPDGNWRAYGLNGDEIPGGPVFRTREEAAEGLTEAAW